MTFIDNTFYVKWVNPTGDIKCVGIMYKDWVILDFADGYLYKWGYLHEIADTDRQGHLIIIGIDSIEGGIR